MARRSNGPRYYASKKTWFANLGGERIPLITGPKKATEERAKELYTAEKQARDGLIEGDYAPVWTVLNAFMNWVKVRKNPAPVGEKRAASMLVTVNSFIELFGDLEARSIKPHHVDEWLNSMAKTRRHERGFDVSWSDATCRLHLSVLKSAFRWASGPGGILSQDPLRHLPKEKVSVNNFLTRQKRVLISEEMHKEIVLRAQKRRNPDFLNVLHYLWSTGARPSEIRLLKASEWEEGAGAFRIRGIKENRGRYKLARTGVDRMIYIPSSLKDLNVQLLESSAHKDGYLFWSYLKRPFTLDGVANALKKVCNSLDFGDNEITLYSYRHSFVTRWLEKGGDPYHLAELLGTSLEMIRKHYSHLFKSHQVLRTSLDRFV